MPNYRRNFVPGGTYFFTCVTYRRRPILTTNLGRKCLREAIQKVQTDHPFKIVSIVLLPDHWHTIWSLPSGDARYPLLMDEPAEEFTERWLEHGGSELGAIHISHAKAPAWHLAQTLLGAHRQGRK
ncbi:MAG: transposase [Planctomycetaceae bacterium]